MVQIPNDTGQAGSALPLVLLVDDDADTREMYSVFLRSAGLAVEEACDAAEALRKAAIALPAVVVTDIVLPDMDGFALCHRLKRSARTSGTRVIALTGYSAPAVGEQAEESRFDAFLLKPCPPDDLLQHIRKTIQDTRSLQGHARDLRARAASLRREIREAWARVSETVDRMSRGR